MCFDDITGDFVSDDIIMEFITSFVSDVSDQCRFTTNADISRSDWCWRGIAAVLPPSDPASDAAAKAADRHLHAALPHVAGDYMGEHWLASFALLALTAG